MYYQLKFHSNSIRCQKVGRVEPLQRSILQTRLQFNGAYIFAKSFVTQQDEDDLLILSWLVCKELPTSQQDAPSCETFLEKPVCRKVAFVGAIQLLVECILGILIDTLFQTIMKCNNNVISGNTYLRQTVFQYKLFLQYDKKEFLIAKIIINFQLFKFLYDDQN